MLAGLFSFASAQVFDTTNVTTPGTLNIVAKGYLTTVTNLTVTGNIDARDFKTMRDSMPLLTAINLKFAEIDAYTGRAGTWDTLEETYPAEGIPQDAFYKNLSFASIPVSLVSKLKSFTFPGNIKSIGQNAFAGCQNLTGTLNIPSTVNYVGNNAFTLCYSLTGSLNIPNSVTYIGDNAFSACSGFTGILTIPPSVDSIKIDAFLSCSGLNGSLTIPSSVTYIGEEAFWNCYGLTGSLIIPSSVKYIGNEAFGYCNYLTSIVALSTLPLTDNNIGLKVFDSDNNSQLYVPYGSVNAYKESDQWNSFNVLPIIEISYYRNELLPASAVHFTASGFINKPVILQWQVNGKNVGTDSAIFDYLPVNVDTIICKAVIENDTILSNTIVMAPSGGTLINTVYTEASVIYPNPNDGNFTVEFSNPDNKVIKISITDVTGKTSFETNTTDNTFNYSLNDLLPGVYFVAIKGEDKFKVLKMVVR